jgi:hypothetical protein
MFAQVSKFRHGGDWALKLATNNEHPLPLTHYPIIDDVSSVVSTTQTNDLSRVMLQHDNKTPHTSHQTQRVAAANSVTSS